MIQPIHDRIVVRKLEVKEKALPSGLVLPEAAQEKPQQGTVVAVGQGRYNDYAQTWIPLTVEPGDTVYFSKYGGTDIDINGEAFLVLSERDVLVRDNVEHS